MSEEEEKKRKAMILADKLNNVLPLIDEFMNSLDDEEFELLEDAIELIKSKQRIEFAKELDNATVLMISGKFTEGEQEKVLRFFNVSDFYEQLKVNEVGTDVQVNREIFFSGKHICELVFYHNESIDAIIHRLEEIKKM